jgi:hypothetical protein
MPVLLERSSDIKPSKLTIFCLLIIGEKEAALSSVKGVLCLLSGYFFRDPNRVHRSYKFRLWLNYFFPLSLILQKVTSLQMS